MDKVDELMDLVWDVVIASDNVDRPAYIKARKKLRKAITTALTQKECAWTYDWDDQWETNCGNRFEFVDGTPTENKMEFCCYCGGKLVEEIK